MSEPFRPTLALLIGLLMIGACRPQPVDPQITPQTEPPAGSNPLPDDEARRLMYALAGPSAGDTSAALDRIIAAGDTRFIAVFIDLMRAAHVGLVDGSDYPRYVEALENLSGESFGEDWVAWFEWYGRSELIPPPGFTGWKGLLLGTIDPGFAAFLRDDLPSQARVEEIQWGGVRVDGIPALDNPRMLPAAETDYLQPGDAVFGLSINGESRAYPLRILDWHEMANDVIGGVPVSLAYCTLCGAAIAYDGRGSDGTIYTFGSSGFLYRSNKLMYDRPTRTLWNHLTGEPVLGEMAGTDFRLNLLPVVLTTWEDWRSQHPDTLVVDVNTGFNRDYSTGAAYADYFADTGTMFPIWQRSDLLEQKDQIYALQVDGVPKAYPIEVFTDEPVINDRVGDTTVVLAGRGESIELEGRSRRQGLSRTWSAGREIRAYERAEEIFSAGVNPGTLIDLQGREWRITEEALLGPEGMILKRLPGHLAYWFGWFAFFPETAVYGQ
ncbi:MAG: DUF3179 domain-containing protein [Chloroflexota bacterium]